MVMGYEKQSLAPDGTRPEVQAEGKRRKLRDARMLA